MTPLDVQALEKRYGATCAVAGVDFQVRAGETVALLGGNGAGKTTTIAMILGLVRPSAGRVTLFGASATRMGGAVRARMNFQSPYVDLPKRLTVAQNLDVYARLYGVADPKTRIAELAEALDLTGFLNRPTGSLSAGQSTRAGLAKALINAPALLLLDEPTASLDPDTADWIRSRLERYCAETGAAVLLASHNMAEVERLAHRVLMMRAGRIVDEGAPQALIAKYGRANMEEVFLHIAREGVAAEATS
ncbi:MAG: ABC transporter ATP-binding protein [Maricaulaceae bacterium]